MTRTELQRAAERLASAADETSDDDAATRLGDLADQLERLATAERGPDHGRMARLQIALGDLEADLSDDLAAEVAAADDDIAAYRETVEGV